MSTELNSGTVGGFGHMGPNDPYNDGHSGSGSSGGSFNGVDWPLYFHTLFIT
jgi:hypothetical protein